MAQIDGRSGWRRLHFKNNFSVLYRIHCVTRIRAHGLIHPRPLVSSIYGALATLGSGVAACIAASSSG
jgi:hypothetical protein